MKIDNKGVTIVEIIVSITLISIVLIFLLRLLISLRDLDDKSLSMLKYEEKVALIVNEVQNDIRDKKCALGNDNADKFEIECSENPNDWWNVYISLSGDENDPQIKYTNNTYAPSKKKVWKFPKGTTFSDLGRSWESNYWAFTFNVIDDKGNAYPIEITHYNTE